MLLLFSMKYSLRSMLGAVVIAAFSLIIIIRVHYVNSALKYIDSIGGDVWCGAKVCDGMSNKDLSISRPSLVLMIFAGESTDIWLCDFPDREVDRERLARILTSLNTRSVNFDFHDDESLNWKNRKFPRLTERKSMSIPAGKLRIEAATKLQDTATTSQERFLMAMNSFYEVQKQDPQFWYRINRYEVLIGYPVGGDFRYGILRDKWRDRTFRIRK
jgi:hypothetical protein